MTCIQPHNINSRFAHSSGCATAGEIPGCAGSSSGLSREGNTIKTDRYEITISKDEVLITDRTNGTTSRVWGDPHISTGDGDKTDFHTGNVTFDLMDGTKLTITPTELNGNVSFIDKVFISSGEKGIVVENIHGDGAVEFGAIGRNAQLVDSLAADGTVLVVGEEADDLFLPDGSELVGDLVANIDGLGGTSRNSFDYHSDPWAGSTTGRGGNGANGTNGGFGGNGGTGALGGANGGGWNPVSRGDANSSSSYIDRMVAKVNGLEGELEALRNKENPSEADYLRMQELQNKISRFYGYISAMTKTEHDTLMAIIRNL